MILVILFWILLLLSVIGIFVPTYVRVSSVILLILIAILGLKVFGNPFTM